MNTPTYLFEFKNIINPKGLQDYLKNWEVEQISDCIFQAKGRDYTRNDLIQLYRFIGKYGHIFVYDYCERDEFFYQKVLKGHKRDRAKDSDLDTKTLHCIEEFLASQPD